MSPRKYNKPPIVEALCEFQFAGDPTNWDITVTDMMYKELRHQFPMRRQAARVTMRMSTDRTEQAILPVTQFLEKDEKNLIQVAPHILTINRLAPYTSWKQFSSLIRKIFRLYRKIASPTSISRIAVRYINKIEFDSKRVELADYFNFYPHVEAELENFGAFMVGIQIPYEGMQDTLKLELISAGHSQEVGPGIRVGHLKWERPIGPSEK